MPATRAAVRHASRQPQPYPPDNAGPSHNDSILIIHDGPLRKRQPVERKTSKQRGKQKARAPLPSAAEIIEISSDEDEPPRKKPSGSPNLAERRIKELEEENKRLKAQIAAVQAVPPALESFPLAQGQSTGQPTDRPFKEFLSTIEEHVTCEICQLKMWHPYSLACGHTYCQDCLRDWFNATYVQHLAKHPNYDAQRLIPAQWRAALARPDLPHHTRANLEREIAMLLSTTPQPSYNCPTCRVLIKAKPAENYIVKNVVHSVAGVQRESAPKEATRGRAMDGPFDGFFP